MVAQNTSLDSESHPDSVNQCKRFNYQWVTTDLVNVGFIENGPVFAGEQHAPLPTSFLSVASTSLVR